MTTKQTSSGENLPEYTKPSSTKLPSGEHSYQICRNAIDHESTSALIRLFRLLDEWDWDRGELEGIRGITMGASNKIF